MLSELFKFSILHLVVLFLFIVFSELVSVGEQLENISKIENING